MTDAVSSDLWYGVCGDKYGWFDPKHVTLLRTNVVRTLQQTLYQLSLNNFFCVEHHRKFHTVIQKWAVNSQGTR